MARRREKIKFSHENYLTTLTEKERREYCLRFSPLITIMSEVDGDKEIMARAKDYDENNGSDMFSEAVNMKKYCIPCQKVECDCCV